MLKKRKTVFTYIRYNVDQIQNIFYPIRYDQDCMILELKVDHKPEEAIAQIKEKKYPEALEDYHGNLLLAGINYDKKNRKHTCKIEKLSV